MIINVVSPAARGVLSQLDPDELPEVCAYLSSRIGEDGELTAPPYEIASTLTELDKPRTFPDFLADFIIGMYDVEAAGGNAEAMNSLGSLYYTGGRGFPQDFEKAVQYYKMAAERGNRQAQENLGYCYYYGRAGEPDYEKAFHYFALGAFDGHLVSLYKIGDMYLNGLYVQKNPQEAFYIYSRVIQTMTQDTAVRVAGPAYLRLGWMFLNGVGVERDVKFSLVCFQRAESFLLDMMLRGEVMYRKSLQSAVEGQKKARERLATVLPQETWDFDG